MSLPFVLPPSVLRWARLLAAPVVAAAAMGVHFALNVPPARTIDATHRKAEERSKPNPRPKPRPKPATVPDEPRDLARLRRSSAAKAFDDEPRDIGWARLAERAVGRAVVVARNVAFEGAPDPPSITLQGTLCQTVRCRFRLRTEFPYELPLVLAELESVRAGARPLWNSFEVGDTTTNDGQAEVTVIVSFTQDDFTGIQAAGAPGTSDAAPPASR